MAELVYDFAACVVSGGTELMKRIEPLREEYSPLCGEYFDRIAAMSEAGYAPCGFLLLDNLLKKHGVDRHNIAISLKPDGRPCVINNSNIAISISCSGKAAFCCAAFGENAAIDSELCPAVGTEKCKKSGRKITGVITSCGERYCYTMILAEE